MAKVTIEGIEYETEGMSDNAKAQTASLQFLEAHLQNLENEIRVFETAKRAYVAQLERQLASPES